MSNPWIRLYRDSLHNPKIVSLNDRQHRIWHNLLLVADDAGELPRVRDIACHLRLSIAEVEQLLAELVEAELIDMAIDGPRKFRLHDWATHQYISDTSTERVRKFRNKNKASNDETFHETERNVSVTPPESETDTDTDTYGLRSFPSAAREDQKFKNGFRKDEGRGQDRLVRKAEGLGIPVSEITAAVNRHKAKNRPAYFTKLCVEWLLANKLPGLDEKIIRDALWGTDDQYAVVMQLLVRVAA